MNRMLMEKLLSSSQSDYSKWPDSELEKMRELAMPVRYLSYDEQQLSFVAWRDLSIIEKEIKDRKEQLDVAC